MSFASSSLGPLRLWLIPIGVCVVSAFLLLALRSFFLSRLRRPRAGRADLFAVVERILRSPSLFWCFAIAVHVGLSSSELPARYANPLNGFVQILIILSVSLAAANLLEATLQHGIARATQARDPRLSGSIVAETGFIHGATRILCFTLGGLLVLARLGIHIGPFLTALGVGGLALGLALQDTLGNLFAGLGLLLDRALLVGDFVKLEGGFEGRIEDIGWRSTKMRMAEGDLIVVPNTKLAQTIAIKKSGA